MLPPAVRRGVAVGFLGLAVTVAAQEPEAILMFTRGDIAGGTVDSIDTRPNTKQPFFVVVKNNTRQQETFTVELEVPVVGPKGTPQIILREVVTLAANETRPVAFKPPPPPKKEEPSTTPAEDKKESGAARKPEPSTGLPVPLTRLPDGLGFVFKVRVLNSRNRPALAGGERTVRIMVHHPARYLNEPDVILEGAGQRRDLIAIVSSPSRKSDAQPRAQEVPLEPPVDVELVFPPQLGLTGTDVGAGTFRRPLARTGQQVTLRAGNLPLSGSAIPVKYHLTVDGYPRAFTYTSNVRRAISANAAENGERRAVISAIRLFPIGTSARAKSLVPQIVSGTVATPRFATPPTKNLRFRIEVDNEAAGSMLVLRIARSGALVRPTPDLDPDEVIDLGLTKQTRVWLEPAGPEGALVVTNSVADHEVGVDVSALRGPHELQAVLLERNPLNPRELKETRTSMNVVVDNTPPPAEDIRFGPFPRRHRPGQPLPVFVTAADPETRIERVTVYLGNPGADGKWPETAPRANAMPTLFGWFALLTTPGQLPADGTDVTAVVENEAGLSTAKTVRASLAGKPEGIVMATVERAGRPQAGVLVTLRDIEGRDRGTATTDAAGIARFVGLQSGVYRLSAARELDGRRFSGFAAARVLDPPAESPAPVTVPLIKRPG
jgi:hypothetical protein